VLTPKLQPQSVTVLLVNGSSTTSRGLAIGRTRQT
jgi:hypothetical protein